MFFCSLVTFFFIFSMLSFFLTNKDEYKAAADKRFGAYWSQKVQLWWQQFFVDFPKNKCSFLHKNKLDIVLFLTGRRAMRRSFSFSCMQSAPLSCGRRRLRLTECSQRTHSTELNGPATGRPSYATS